MNEECLLIIDMQKGLDDVSFGKRNNYCLEENVALLLSKFREAKLPVIHVKHTSLEEKSPLRKGLIGNEYKSEAVPLENEMQFEKTVNSAFIGTNLEDYLKEKEIRTLIIVGMTTDHCISTTVRMASNLGFNIKLVSDATATFDRKSYDGVLYEAEEIHKINLLSLNGEFCRIFETKEILKNTKSDK